MNCFLTITPSQQRGGRDRCRARPVGWARLRARHHRRGSRSKNCHRYFYLLAPDRLWRSGFQVLAVPGEGAPGWACRWRRIRLTLWPGEARQRIPAASAPPQTAAQLCAARSARLAPGGARAKNHGHSRAPPTWHVGLPPNRSSRLPRASTGLHQGPPGATGSRGLPWASSGLQRPPSASTRGHCLPGASTPCQRLSGGGGGPPRRGPRGGRIASP